MECVWFLMYGFRCAGKTASPSGIKGGKHRLVFERTGAYSVTEGIALFLSRDLPEVYFWSGKKGLEKVRNRIESFRMNTWQADGKH